MKRGKLPLAYAGVVATMSPAALRLAFLRRSPRATVAVWLTAAVFTVLAVVLAGLALVVPRLQVSHRLSDRVGACIVELRASYGEYGAWAAICALLLITIVVGRIIGCGAALAVASHRMCQGQRRHIRLLSVAHERHPDVVVVEHDAVVAYCVPGRQPQVVVTTGALSVLGEEQLDAVVAHERAHLAGRHHLLRMMIVTLDRSMPGVPLFRHGRRHVQRLLEVIADDVALRQCRRTVLLDALLLLAEQGPGVAMPGEPDCAGVARAQRLLRHEPVACRWVRTAAWCATAALALLPPLVAAGPAMAAVDTDHCAVDLADPDHQHHAR